MISVKANTATSLPQFGHWRQLTDISIEEKGVTEGISFIAGLQDSFCEIQSATPCSLCTYPICKGSTFPPFKTLFLGSEQYWSHSKSRSEQAEFTVKQKSQLIYIYYPRVASVFKDMENVFTEETCKSCLQKDPQLIPNSVLHLSEYQGEKKKAQKSFCCIFVQQHQKFISIIVHPQQDTEHIHIYNISVNISTSLPVFPSQALAQQAGSERQHRVITSFTTLSTRGFNHSTQQQDKSHFLSYK